MDMDFESFKLVQIQSTMINCPALLLMAPTHLHWSFLLRDYSQYLSTVHEDYILGLSIS